MKTSTRPTWTAIRCVLAALSLGAILDPAFGASSVQFSANTLFADENQTPAHVSIQRSGDATGDVTVTVVATNKTAIAGEDYLPVSAPITFAPGETNKVVEIPLLDDYFAEPDKTLTLQLADFPGGVTSARPEATLFVRDNERPGSIDSSWHSTLPPLGTNEVMSAEIVTHQPDGKLIVNVTVFDTATFDSLFWQILRLNADGSLDSTFPVIEDQTQSNGEQQVVAMPDGKILVVGYNIHVGKGLYHLKYRLNPDGTQDMTFTNTLTADEFLDLVPLPDGKILVNGYDRSPLLNGSPIPKLSRLNNDGTLDPTFTAPGNLALSSLWPTSNGKVMGFAYGQSGFDPSKLYRLNQNGSPDGGFTVGTAAGTPNMIGTVITQSDGKLVVGGVFRTFNGQVRNSIVGLNPDGSIDPDFQTGQGFLQPGGFPTDVGQPYQLWPLPGGRILVGVGGGYELFDGEKVTPPIILNPDGRRDPAFEGTLFDGIGEVWNASPSVVADSRVYFATGYGLGRLNMDLPLRIVSHLRGSDGTTRLTANALIGRSYRLQASENLANWSDLAIQLATTNRIEFADAPTNSPANRFYRVKGN